MNPGSTVRLSRLILLVKGQPPQGSKVCSRSTRSARSMPKEADSKVPVAVFSKR